ncbi:MAG: hypothetical protein WCI72_02190 [archaeon]
MVTEAQAFQKQEVDIFEQMATETGKKEALTKLKGKSDLVRKANEEYLATFKQGTEQALAGQGRQVQEQSQLEAALQTGKDFESYVGQTVDFLTSTFGEIDQYLGNITSYQPAEQALLDQAKALTEKAGKWYMKPFINTATLEAERVALQKRADVLRTERILKSSLDKNITMILDYYKSMKDVMYSAGINNQKSANEVKAVRDLTMGKLTENEQQYDAWQADRKVQEAKLEALELELTALNGEQRTQKDAERILVRDALEKAKTQEGHYFGIVKNAQIDLKYQEQVLGNFRDIVRGINNGLVDMQQKIDNRTVLFANIETILKTGYQVKSFGLADTAMDRTTAEIARTSVIYTEAVLGELGSRTVAKPMSPDELNTWIARSKAAREKYEAVIGTAQDEYAAPEAVRP